MQLHTDSPRDLERASAALAIGIGLAAAASPRTLVRAYGTDPDEMTGAGELSWRLFASRNLVVGSAALAGSTAARDAILAIQFPDQLVFAHALLSRSVPPVTAVAAMFTSGLIIAAGLRGRASR